MKLPASQTVLTQILDRFSQYSVVVIGDVGVDRYTVGTVDRISPEAPVPIVKVTNEYFKLGLAANVADNIKALGGKPFLLGMIGRDRFSEDFSELLKKAEISDQYLVRDGSRKTILKDRIVSERQQLLRVDHESCEEMSDAFRHQVLDQVDRLFSQRATNKISAVILEDYAKGFFHTDMIKALAEKTQAAGIPLLADPNERTALTDYRGVTVLTPNRKEAETLTGIKIKQNQDLHAVGAKLLEVTNAQHVIITLGKDGMAIFNHKNESVQMIPTFAREVYDVSGAGDTVIAVLALALAAGATMADAAVLANLAAGVEVGKRGTATVTPAEVTQAILMLSAGSAR